MENKQLASYWIAEKVGILIENLLKGYYKSQEEFDADWHNLFNQAGEMEKEQIIKAIERYYPYSGSIRAAEKYYNETYGRKP